MGNNNDMNRDQVAGRTDQAVGEVKETVGEATGDKDLQREGLGDQIAGRAQEHDGDRKEAVDDIVDTASTKALRDEMLDKK